jgi:hypothetical protein
LMVNPGGAVIFKNASISLWPDPQKLDHLKG